MSRILLLGDIAPVGLTHARLDFASLHADGGFDLVVGNLETPLDCHGLTPAVKAGPVLSGEAAVVEPFAALGKSVVFSLANNHLADFGVAGIERTVARLVDGGINPVGAGSTATEAHAACEVTGGKGQRIVVVAGSERQFGQVGTVRGGVAGMDDLIGRVKRASDDGTVVIATVHGGAEDTAWPSPAWQVALRELVEAGAHLVHAHHPHRRQGFERWRDGWIVYSPGHTLVNPTRWGREPDGNEGWAFAFDTDTPEAPPSVHALRGVADGGGVKIVSTPSKIDWADYNHPLTDATLLHALWQHYAAQLYTAFYEPGLEGGCSRLVRLRHHAKGMLRAILRPVPSAQREAWLYHVAACPTHRDAIATALGLRLGEVEDLRSEASRAWFERVVMGLV